MSDSAILTAALAYAARGWAVFPCHPGTKAPLTKRGLKEASADAAVIRQWWAKWSDAMIGLPLGGATGLFALDFDPREEQDPETGEIVQVTYSGLRAETEALLGRELPATAASRTPSGGFHVFYRQPDGAELGNRKGRLPKHVDVRGLGGYVIAPPSVRADGRAYEWVKGRDPDSCAPVEAPPELVEVLRGQESTTQKPNGDSGLGPESGRAVTTPSSGSAADEAVRRYGLAALDREIDALSRIGQGGRNQALNNAALTLGSLVAAGALGEAIVRAGLQQAAQANGLWGDDGARACLATIDSGLKAGLRNPRDLSDVRDEAERRAGRVGSRPRRPAAGGGSGGGDGGRETPASPAAASSSDAAAPLRDPPSDARSEDDESSQEGGAADDGWEGESAGPDGEDLDQWCAWRPLTDLGNAERFHARFGQNYLYTVAGGWLVWDGRRWEPHFHGKPPRQLMLDIHRCVRLIREEGDAISNKRRREALREWARKSEAAGKINAIVGLFQPMVTVRDDLFDQDPLLFNVQNGTLRFSKDEAGFWGVELRPHDRADMITKVGGVAYDRTAACPAYDDWIALVQPDAEVRAFLHRWNGVSLTGVKVQKLVQSYGTGGNGKGTAAELYAEIAGDYAGTINIESLLATNARSGQGASPDIAKLPGIRMLRVTEPDEGALLAEALVKRLTGGDPIDARHNYGPFFTFKPVFKMTLQGNYKLKIKGNDAGIWRRMRLLKWDVTIPEEQQREDFKDALEAELPGILNHLVAGALDYLQHGLAEPDAVKEETAKYRDESDPVGQFLALCVRSSPGARLGSRALHEVYSAWAKWSGNIDRSGRPLSELKFGERMETANYRRIKSGSMFWLDIELVKQASDFVDMNGNPLPQGDAEPAPADLGGPSTDGRTDWEDWT